MQVALSPGTKVRLGDNLSEVTIKDVLHKYESIEGLKKNRSKKVFYRPAQEHLLMWEAAKSSPWIQLMFVLVEETGEKEDSKRLVLGGCLLLLRRKVQIPRGDKSFILPDDADAEMADGDGADGDGVDDDDGNM